MPYALPYAPDDDITARAIVAAELRHPSLDRWRAMMSDAYIHQTYRVLCSLDRDVAAAFAQRRAEQAESQAAYTAREISAHQRALDRAEYETWKAKALVFRNKVYDRRDQLVPRVRELRGDTGYQHVRDSYLTLATAVAHHRMAVATGSRTRRSTYDRLLWTLLDTLTITTCRTAPDEKLHLIPLSEAINRRRPQT